jgi:hypothetical protein
MPQKRTRTCAICVQHDCFKAELCLCQLSSEILKCRFTKHSCKAAKVAESYGSEALRRGQVPRSVGVVCDCSGFQDGPGRSQRLEGLPEYIHDARTEAKVCRVVGQSRLLNAQCVDRVLRPAYERHAFVDALWRNFAVCGVRNVNEIGTSSLAVEPRSDLHI